MEMTASYEFDSPAASIWALLEDFGAIERWWPKGGQIQIEKVELEGEGIGMVRRIYNKGMDKPINERLDFLDPENHTLILSIVGDRQGGITAYVAIGKLVETGPRQCRMDYRAYLTTLPGEEDRVSKGILFTWEMMFDGLQQTAR